MIDKIIHVSAFYKLIIPISATDKGKTPAVKWKKDPTGTWPSSDPKVLRAWWKKHPDHHVGAVIGQNWWVLDLDVDAGKKKDGLTKMKELGFDLEELKKSTYWAETPRGGVHLYFKWTSKCAFRTGSDVIEDLSGIDTRTPGNSYVRIAPTKGFTLHGTPGNMTDAPDKLIDLLNKGSKKEYDGPMHKPMDPSKKKVYSEAEVASYLTYVNIKDYRSRSQWMNVMIDVNAQSHGAEWGKDLFKDWSAGDTHEWTEDPEEVIDKEWRTLDPNGPRTGATLESQANIAGRFDDLTQAAEGVELDETNIPYSINNKEMLLKTDNNFMLLFTSAVDHMGNKSEFNNLYFYDELREEIMYSRVPPWQAPESKLEELTKTDECAQELKIQLEVKYGVSYSLNSLDRLIAAVAKRDCRNPVIDYLDGLPKWDNKSRVDEIFVRVGGAEDTKYHRKVAAHMMISAVARAYDPGCKVDTMTVIEGGQGQGKSTLIDVLGGEFYCVPDMSAKGKDSLTSMRGWFNEWAELAGANKREVESIKSFISTRIDTYRPSYGRHAQNFKRRGILVATTNPEADGAYLMDATGARRFNPVYCAGAMFNLKWLKENRDQIFAEAKARYFLKEAHWFLPSELSMAKTAQEDRTSIDTWQTRIEDWLTVRYDDEKNFKPEDRAALSPTAIAFDCLQIPVKDHTHMVNRRIGNILKTLGYHMVQQRVNGVRRRVFIDTEEMLRRKTLADLQQLEELE